jgi:hypothetical protein
MITHRWHSIDAHFHDGAWRILQSVLPIKAAKNSFITQYTLLEVSFYKTHDQKSLMLRWRSFSRWGREGIPICFAYKCRQKFLYDWVQPIGGVISKDTWPKIIDASLTLIFMMGPGGYWYLCCLYRWPTIPLWLTATYRRCHFPGRMTTNRWHSVDAYFAMAVSTICNHSFWHSPSFILCWLSFWRFHIVCSWSLRCYLLIHWYI